MFNINSIFYPSYVIAVPRGNSILYIPTQGRVGLFNSDNQPIDNKNYNSLSMIKETVFEGFDYEGRLYLYDAIPLKDYKSKKCNMIYTDRLSLLREILFSYIAEPYLYTEANIEKIDNPQQLKTFYSNCLTDKYKSVIIKNSLGRYTWGNETEDHLLLSPKG